MVDTLSNTINNVYYLGINMGDRDCILGGMLVVMALLFILIVVMAIVGIVKWVKNGGITKFLEMIKNEFEFGVIHAYTMSSAIVRTIIFCIGAVLFFGIMLFIFSLFGKLAGMC
jgi:hypothetical protein